jgi:hypothetical protein
MTDTELRRAWNALDHEGRVNALGDALAYGIRQRMELYDWKGMGQVPDFLAKQAKEILAPLVPALGSELAKIAQPAAEKAAAAMKPMIDEQLTKHVPTFAIFAGLAAGFFTVIGMLLIKKFG